MVGVMNYSVWIGQFVVKIDHDFEFKLTQQERLHINNDYILYTNNDCERPFN